jgi:hypothetical protein
LDITLNHMVGFDINCLLYQYILLVRDICEKYQLRSKVMITQSILKLQKESTCKLKLFINQDKQEIITIKLFLNCVRSSIIDELK